MIRLGKLILVCLAFLFGVLQSVRAEDEPVISFSVRQAPIEKVLLEIEKQVGKHISFESSLLKNIPPVTLSVQNQPLSLCLYELFYTYEIEWLVTGDYLILKRKSESYSPQDSMKLISLQEFIVEADSLRNAAVLTDEPGKEVLSGKQLLKIPAIMSQPDLIKGIQQLPGVAMGMEGMSGMYVRGGNNDENLFLIDGMPVYQVSHIGGLFSAFNPDVVDKLDFYKGYFPAKYDGRLSSVTDIHTKQGNMKKWHGSFGVGLIQGNAHLEGPLIKDRLSFHFAIRRSWADLITAPTFAILNNGKLRENPINPRYSFHDINGRMDYVQGRSRFSLGVYSGDDLFRMTLEDKTIPKYYSKNKWRVRWGNFASVLNWNYQMQENLESKFTASYTRYRSKLFYSSTERNGYYTQTPVYTESATVSGIDDGRLSWVLTYRPTTLHQIQAGISTRLQAFRPEYMEFLQADIISSDGSSWGNIQERQQNQIRMIGNETVLFLSDRFYPLEHLRIDAGLSFSTFYLKHKLYAQLSPRISARYLLNRHWSAKLAYSRMTQPVHLIPATYLDLPTDIWMPSTDKVKPSVSDQISVGLHYSPNREYSFSMEAYYKNMQHLSDFKPWVGRFPDGMAWEDKLTQGTGRAYGTEWIVRKNHGRFTGWIGYTLSWADRQFAEINGGKRFPSRFDNRHKLNLVASYRPGKKVELNASWVYSKGNWITLNPYGNSLMENLTRNNYQLPDYHRLDLGVNIYHTTKKGHTGIWNIGIYNAYCRKNPVLAWSEDYDEATRKIKVRQLSIFPIVPSFSYTYKF